jgi:TPR repeat protein
MAALMLGRYLRKGLTAAPDPVAAARWLNQALSLGVAEARLDLAELAPQLAAATGIQPAPIADNAVPYRAAGD